jgi:hypothetical protein
MNDKERVGLARIVKELRPKVGDGMKG